jgi:CheY-like chemotaxis protein
MSEPKVILIVDDDPDFKRAVAHLFESCGHRVWMADNGRQGFDLAKTVRPDLIVLDVMMAERTEGFFTLGRIRNDPALRETPVIVVSSVYADHPEFRVSPEAGWLPADLFLAKPIDPARLVEESARLMTAPAPSAGRRQAGSRGR